MNTLKDHYDVRAALAFTLEQDARMEKPLDARSLAHYERLCADLVQLGRDWLAARQPAPVPRPLTAWCRVCSSTDLAPLPGLGLCRACAAVQTDGPPYPAILEYLIPEGDE